MDSWPDLWAESGGKTPEHPKANQNESDGDSYK